MKLLVFLLGIAIASPTFAQTTEKKVEKKKAVAKKKSAEPKQDWGRFNSNAKKDQKAMDKKKAEKKE